MRITGLIVYPIKSCAALPVQEWDLDERGLGHDREYMVVDDRGDFLTQREEPRLALVVPELGAQMIVRTPKGSATVLEDGRRGATVWGFTGPAIDCGDDVADLLGAFLGRPVRLVRTPPDHGRLSDDGRAGVGFADGYPLLLTSEASLADLNARLQAPLPMDRFRPNIVVDAATPFEEDDWLRLTLGLIPAQVAAPCVRCSMTRVDQATGRRSDGEPLRTLATFRRGPRGVVFGQNLVHAAQGTLRVGDPVSVTERRS